MIEQLPAESRLSRLGWQATDRYRYKPMRVAAVQRNSYLLWGEAGERLGRIAGRLRYQSAGQTIPTVGDWVDFEEADGTGTIHRVIPRRSLLVRSLQSRKVRAKTKERRQLLCANVDSALIMFSMAQPLNTRLIERYLAFVAGAGVKPVLVLSHQDVAEKPKSIINSLATVSPEIYGLNTHSASCKRRLQPELKTGQTLVLLGPSGVGKSTLINSLVGKAVQKTQTQRKNGSGRHTTVERRLWLCNPVVIIDTPGLRSLSFDSAEIDLSVSFSDLLTLQNDCEFRNCRHQAEPGCALLKALAEGCIDEQRWQHFRQLLDDQRRT